MDNLTHMQALASHHTTSEFTKLYLFFRVENLDQQDLIQSFSIIDLSHFVCLTDNAWKDMLVSWQPIVRV